MTVTDDDSRFIAIVGEYGKGLQEHELAILSERDQAEVARWLARAQSAGWVAPRSRGGRIWPTRTWWVLTDAGRRALDGR